MVTISTSNKKIIELLEKNEPFLISRLGIGAETYLTYQYLSGSRINLNYLNALNNNAGIYNVNKTLRNYLDLYSECIKNSDYLAYFTGSIINEQNFFINKYNLNILHSRVLEPFYSCLENEKPWSQYLINKKVLVISPFVESFKKQLNNNFQIFKDSNKKIFLDDQEFIFYKSYQTSAGNHLHNDWFETYNLMKNDITNIDFDIALVSCGGYGLPLCNYIKTTMNKSAIYIGGGLQLLFGVMGKRWESNQMWNNIIRENDTNFIKPSGDEIMENNNNIEGGCYW
tara:strand:+ start:15972 stop:16823 length:852 start_codon:yes stop_codon:yes gene_type:complete